jgi:4-carboxymuconolactone decarboxylase
MKVVYEVIKKKEKTDVIRTINKKEPIHLPKPRIYPLEKSKWDEDVLVLLGDYEKTNNRPVPNIFTTIANHSKLLKRWSVFGNHVLFKSTLSPREREILILRIGWLCRSEYEWGQHVIIGKRCGLSDEEIQRIIKGPDAIGWEDFETTLLRAVDELYINAFISNETWETLSKRYDSKQLLDLIFTVGQYHLLAMALNTLGVQLDKGVEGFP